MNFAKSGAAVMGQSCKVSFFPTASGFMDLDLLPSGYIDWSGMRGDRKCAEQIEAELQCVSERCFFRFGKKLCTCAILSVIQKRDERRKDRNYLRLSESYGSAKTSMFMYTPRT